MKIYHKKNNNVDVVFIEEFWGLRQSRYVNLNCPLWIHLDEIDHIINTLINVDTGERIHGFVGHDYSRGLALSVYSCLVQIREIERNMKKSRQTKALLTSSPDHLEPQAMQVESVETLGMDC